MQLGFIGKKAGNVSADQEFGIRHTLQVLHVLSPTCMHVDDYSGSDGIIAFMAAKHAGVPIVLHPHSDGHDDTQAGRQDFMREGPSTVHIKNAVPYAHCLEDIVYSCKVLLAAAPTFDETPDDQVWDMVRLARRLEKTIVVIWPDGRITRDPADVGPPKMDFVKQND